MWIKLKWHLLIAHENFQEMRVEDFNNFFYGQWKSNDRLLIQNDQMNNESREVESNERKMQKYLSGDWKMSILQSNIGNSHHQPTFEM